VTVSGDDSYGFGDGDAGSGDQAAWQVTSDTQGEAMVTGTYQDYFDDTETFDETVTFGIRGTAEIIDGEVVVSVDPDGSGYY
ncbi:MAG TPA: hypothetical protein VK039_05970, partial [Brevibacterium sp.]|nr:hypothetical protein [Brevibacterium sp.]